MFVEHFDVGTLPGYLDFLRKRPLMILPKKELGYLDANIQGYLVNKGYEYLWFKGFDDFVTLHVGLEENEKGWRETILTHCKHDEEKAFDLFFDVFDTYVEEVKPPK